MIKSDIDTFIENWPLTSKKIFVYKQEFLADEYITIVKTMEKNLELTSERTIDVIPYLVDKVTNFIIMDEFIKLMSSEQLKEQDDKKWFMNIIDLKTGGCDMGCWATSNPDIHSFDCRKYTKSGK